MASYLEQPRRIWQYLDLLTTFDLTLQARGQEPTGCTDDLARLWAESLPTPSARRAGYQEVLEGAADLPVERSLRTALLESWPARIERTRSQDRWNRWAGLFNSATRNLGRLATGQIGGGVRFLVDLVFSHRHFTRVTEQERKEWWLIDNSLRSDREQPDAQRLARRMTRLEERFRKDAMDKYMRAARVYADRGWWRQAFFYVKTAQEAGYRGKRRFRRQVLDAVGRQRRGLQKSLEVEDVEFTLRIDEQVTAYTRLLEALTLGDFARLRRVMPAAAKALAGTSMADEAEDVLSVMHEWAGDRRQAMDVQHDLAFRYPDRQTGRAALARLSDPYYNPRARYDHETAAYRARQWHYVLTGERSAISQVELITRLITPSLPELGMAGAFFLTDVLVRSLVVSLQNPVSPENVLAAGEQLLADPSNLLTEDEAQEIRVALGVLYQKLRRYDKAADAYRAAHILSPELDRELAETAADRQYRRILQVPDVNRRVLLLDRLVATYPGTNAAARARDRLAQLRPETKVDFEIPRTWLVEDPAHWMRLGARIPPDLIDGSRGNGELNERGLVFWRDRPGVATFVLEDGLTSGRVQLTPRRRAALRASAELWADERIALDAAGDLLATPNFPFEIRGSAGSQGLLVFPTLQTIPVSEEDKRKFR